MAKAIHWPASFDGVHYRDEVLAENQTTLHAAVRLGTLYFDPPFWTPGEEVDIRVNHKVLRRGIVEGNLWSGPIAELPEGTYPLLKSNINDSQTLCAFLHQAYQQPVNAETIVTVVYYRNLPIDPELLETA